jgi:hypothetical protein
MSKHTKSKNRETMVRECLAAARADLQDQPYSQGKEHKYLADLERELAHLTDKELRATYDAWFDTATPTEAWLVRNGG